VKKYFSIAEAASITSLPVHRLRYIEKSDPRIKITKIRDRRYYTVGDIDYIKKNYNTSGTDFDKSILNSEDRVLIISRIDTLIEKFRTLSNSLL